MYAHAHTHNLLISRHCFFIPNPFLLYFFFPLLVFSPLFLSHLCLLSNLPLHIYSLSVSCVHVSALLHSLVRLKPAPGVLVGSEDESEEEVMPVTLLPCQWKEHQKRKAAAMEVAEAHEFGKEMLKALSPLTHKQMNLETAMHRGSNNCLMMFEEKDCVYHSINMGPDTRTTTSDKRGTS